MTVQSRPMKNGVIQGGDIPRNDPQPQAAEAQREKPREAAPAASKQRVETGKIVGVFAIIIGMPLWAEVARYTRDGWIVALNWLCVRFSIPWSVPPLHWAVAVMLLLALGIGYSHIEIDKQPIQRRGGRWVINRHWEVWVVWAVLVATDVGTNYLGARQPDPSGLSIVRDIAADTYKLLVYAILITFIPDRLIQFGWRKLRGK